MKAQAKWQDRLDSQREMKRRGLKLLYQRVKLLVEIYDDESFHKWCESEGVTDIEFLDSELSDVGMDFMTLRAVFDAYPREAHWINGDIRQMVATVVEQSKEKRKKERGERETISWKDRCLRAEEECERLRGEVEHLTEKVAELKELLGLRAGVAPESCVA